MYINYKYNIIILPMNIDYDIILLFLDSIEIDWVNSHIYILI